METKNAFFLVRTDYDADAIYLGSYDTEEEAIAAADQVVGTDYGDSFKKEWHHQGKRWVLEIDNERDPAYLR